MTSLKEENKRKNIREEMEKAGETINAATLLFDNGFSMMLFQGCITVFYTMSEPCF
jgi:hypothetical protein